MVILVELILYSAFLELAFRIGAGIKAYLKEKSKICLAVWNGQWTSHSTMIPDCVMSEHKQTRGYQAIGISRHSIVFLHPPAWIMTPV
jgi:hypothetical protein